MTTTTGSTVWDARPIPADVARESAEASVRRGNAVALAALLGDDAEPVDYEIARAEWVRDHTTLLVPPTRWEP